jgi:hypothetical protein
MIYIYLDTGYTLEIMLPMAKAHNYYYQFLVINRVMDL